MLTGSGFSCYSLVQAQSYLQPEKTPSSSRIQGRTPRPGHMQAALRPPQSCPYTGPGLAGTWLSELCRTTGGIGVSTAVGPGRAQLSWQAPSNVSVSCRFLRRELSAKPWGNGGGNDRMRSISILPQPLRGFQISMLTWFIHSNNSYNSQN